MKTNDSHSQVTNSNPPPKIIYKYKSLDGKCFEFAHTIFSEDELYFPHPNEINDPFDCKVSASWDNINKRDILIRLEKIKSKAKHSVELSKIQLAINNVNVTSLENIIEAIKNQYDEGNLQNVGVLSLTTKHQNIQMWSHYANSHKGICIGFNYNRLFFMFNRTPLYADSVNYPSFNHYPKWDYFGEDNRSIIDKLYFTKALDWEYENEWRIVFPEKGGTRQKFQPDALASVHLGCRIDKQHREAVIEWCLKRKFKPKIYEMTKAESSYSLTETEIVY